MCRFCEAIGPICRYITDPHWSDGTYDRVPHHPPPPDDLLADPEQTTSVQPAGLNGPQRPRTARPKAAARRKPFVKTGASRPKPAVFPDRLHWPALASGTHRRLRSVCQLHKSARSPDKPWFTPEPGLPNDAEKLCYAFLVANIDWDVGRLCRPRLQRGGGRDEVACAAAWEVE